MLHTSNGSKKSTQFQEDLLKLCPSLRKIALEMIKSDRILNVSQAAKEAGVSAKSAKVAAYRERKKGNNFDELKSKIAYQKLISVKPRMYRELIRQGLKGSYRHMELYFRLTGDLRPESRTGPETVNNSLTVFLEMPETSKISTKAEVIEAREVEEMHREQLEVLNSSVIRPCPLCTDKTFDTLDQLRAHLSSSHSIVDNPSD